MALMRIESTPKRVRARIGGRFVADSTRARILFLEGRLPEYRMPVEDLDAEALTRTDEGRKDRYGRYEVVTHGEHKVGRAWLDGPLEGLAALEESAVDAWFEEDDQMVGHLRDPYRRVDVYDSSRHLLARVNGVVVAETTHPRLAVETRYPERWYFPFVDVDFSRLRPSERRSFCPYKGPATWWHADLGEGGTVEDVAWAYELPLPDGPPKLAGYIGFYREVEGVEVVLDGEVLPTPTPEPSWASTSVGLQDLTL